MELENQPTTDGACYGSHWEQRLMPHEMMASTRLGQGASVRSTLTLAALEDSGWRRAAELTRQHGCMAALALRRGARSCC